MAGRDGGRRIGNALILIGGLLLLAVIGYFGWTQYRGANLRAQLREASPATAVAPASPTAESLATAVPTTPSAPDPMATPETPPASPEPGAPTATPRTDAPTPIPPTVVSAALPASGGPPVRIVIPDLQIDAPVVEMGWQVVQTANGLQSEWVIPEDEAGHHLNSAVPGEVGNIVISGHNNIYGRVFEPISQAWDDDQRQVVDEHTFSSDILTGRTIQLVNESGQLFEYRITDFYRLTDTGVSLTQRIDNARFMQLTSEPQLTLVTCWPPWNNTHRLVVIARPVDSVE